VRQREGTGQQSLWPRLHRHWRNPVNALEHLLGKNLSQSTVSQLVQQTWTIVLWICTKPENIPTPACRKTFLAFQKTLVIRTSVRQIESRRHVQVFPVVSVVIPWKSTTENGGLLSFSPHPNQKQAFSLCDIKEKALVRRWLYLWIKCPCFTVPNAVLTVCVL